MTILKIAGIMLLIGLAILIFTSFFKETDWTAVLMGAGLSILVTYLGGWLQKVLEGSDNPKSPYWWADIKTEPDPQATRRDMPESVPVEGDTFTTLIYLFMMLLPIVIPYRMRNIGDLPGSPWHTLVVLIPVAWIVGPLFRYVIVKKIAAIWSE